jgi:hypothetical protein
MVCHWSRNGLGGVSHVDDLRVRTDYPDFWKDGVDLVFRGVWQTVGILLAYC